MTLNFPNVSRSYDARRNLIRFWGHDSALEIPFFVEVSALDELPSRTMNAEAGYLHLFDAALTRIHEIACKAYSRGSRSSYLLTAADFER
jgi:hypothetical protein